MSKNCHKFLYKNQKIIKIVNFRLKIDARELKNNSLYFFKRINNIRCFRVKNSYA